jgi:type IV pilus assembly protein PilY1
MIMSVRTESSIALIGGVLWAVLAGGPAMADDTELFVFDGSAVAANPNVLFIFDTSGSMSTVVQTQESYDPAKTYAGACASGKLYWQRSSWSGSETPPACDSVQTFDRSALECHAAFDAFATTAGRLTDQFAVYNPSNGHERWEELNASNPSSWSVECEDDNGRYGDGNDTSAPYAQDGDGNDPWTGSVDDVWRGHRTYTVYDANYLNWYYGPVVSSTRSQVMKDVATSLVGSINGVNIGLMIFNDSQGGHLVHAVEDVAGSRSTLVGAINALSGSGLSPLSETLYEASRYFLGDQPYYGADYDVGVVSGAYDSPIKHACQKNYVVYLTDGEPAEDVDADGMITALPGFGSIVGSPSCDGSGDGACLDDLAEYLYKADLSPDLPGKQNVVTYTIGFTVDLPLLTSTASRGGGKYYTADDTASLSQALTNVVTSILETQASFTSPTVAVNAFNRTQHLNDLYVAVFQPSSTMHWPGNLKRYRLRPSDATIVDVNDAAAVDASTGFFKEDARSWWSPTADGNKVGLGGTAGELPSPASRNVYTYLGGSDLTASTNAVDATNALLTDTVLQVGNAGDPTRDEVIDFMLGRDVADSNQNNSTTDARNQVGDPLHSQPVSMIYGGTAASPDPTDAVVYFATNDGYLHAIDAASGIEKWSFVAPEFLADQAGLLVDPTTPEKHYGIDGDLQLQVLADDDGVIDPSSDKVYLFFGMRRGGTVYYGLDVTNPDAPRLLWRLDSTDLPGIGQTWSKPVPTRIHVDDPSQSPDQLAVVFGGGYDTSQDNYTASTDNSGNGVYIVDSESGALLWHGGPANSTKNFAAMQYSIPADVKVVDLDGDGFADRMYAADMGGQVWRFDIFNGRSAADLVEGGVIAQLGSAGLSTPTDAETRRFYYSPDVALVSNSGAAYLHIGIGSGYRAHPNATLNQDRFYALRDYAAFSRLSDIDYGNLTPITEADLTDVTDSPDAALASDSPGWLIRLDAGEKVLAEARTFANQVYFTTFKPGAPPSADDCEPRLGTNKLYVVSLVNGAPVTNLDGSVDDTNLTVSDRAREFSGSISSDVVFLFPSAEDPENCVGDECTPPPVACVDLFCFPTDFQNNPIRTFWIQNSLDR